MTNCKYKCVVTVILFILMQVQHVSDITDVHHTMIDEAEGKATCSCCMPFVHCKPCIGLLVHSSKIKINHPKLVEMVDAFYLTSTWSQQYLFDISDKHLVVSIIHFSVCLVSFFVQYLLRACVHACMCVFASSPAQCVQAWV